MILEKDFIKKIIFLELNQRLTLDLILNHPFMKETPLPDEITRYTLRKSHIYIFNYDISQIFDYQPQI